MQACRAVVAMLAFAPGGCLLQDNPEYDDRCGDGRFAFGVIADASSVESLPRVLAEIAARTDVHAVFGAGDLVPMGDVRAAVDAAPAPIGECAPPSLAWFPALGAAEVARPDDLAWFTDSWVGTDELPGLRAFTRGPGGTAYAFEYQGVHFSVIDTYEGGLAALPGVASASEQHEWLRDEIARTDADTRFVIGHVPIEAACYRDEPGCDWYPENCSPPSGDLPWEAPPDVPDTAALAKTFAELDVDAYLHGRDNIPGRRLLDGSGAVIVERLIFDVYDTCANTIDAMGDPSAWTAAQAQPGRFWQVDAGGLAPALGSYAVVTVTPDAVQYELFVVIDEAATQLFDTWSVPR